MPGPLRPHVHHRLPISSLHHPALQTEARPTADPTLVLHHLSRGDTLSELSIRLIVCDLGIPGIGICELLMFLVAVAIASLSLDFDNLC